MLIGILCAYGVVGLPSRVGGLADVVNSPKYSTGVGLLLHAAMEEVEAPRKGYSGLNGAGAGLRKVSDKFWNWVTQAL